MSAPEQRLPSASDQEAAATASTEEAPETTDERENRELNVQALHQLKEAALRLAEAERQARRDQASLDLAAEVNLKLSARLDEERCRHAERVASLEAQLNFARSLHSEAGSQREEHAVAASLLEGQVVSAREEVAALKAHRDDALTVIKAVLPQLEAAAAARGWRDALLIAAQAVVERRRS